MNKRILVVAALLLFGSSFASAANHYVWCGASGSATGADFTNAYTDLPASLTRGDTYYIAGSLSCSYGYHSFSDAVSGTSVISVLAATSSNSSGVAGWQAGFGTTPAEWLTTGVPSLGHALWNITSSYYTFDGQYGTGTGTNDSPNRHCTTTVYGFCLESSADNVTQVYIDAGAVAAASVSNLTFNHIEIDGVIVDPNAVLGQTGFYTRGNFVSSQWNAYNNFTLQNLFIHDTGYKFINIMGGNTWTIDHSWFARVSFNAADTLHANGLSLSNGSSGCSAPDNTNITLSYDTWEDAAATSVITVMNGTTEILNIYGNVFLQTQEQAWDLGGSGTIGDLANNGCSAAVTTGANIYNNTFINQGPTSGVRFNNFGVSGIVAKNNLVWGSSDVAFESAGVVGAILLNGLTVNNGGSGYVVNDTGPINGTCSGAKYKVATVSGGVVLTVSVNVQGTACTVANGVSTSDTIGTGSGLTVNITAVTNGTAITEDHNTLVNSTTGASVFSCTGTGDSCNVGAVLNTLTSSSVTSNVATLNVASTSTGLTVGSPVIVLGAQKSGSITCGIDTVYPFPTVATISVSGSTTLTYNVPNSTPDATCQASFGKLLVSTAVIPFTNIVANSFGLVSETVDVHLNDGTTLSAPYNTDPLGLTRGADGTWERGALEFQFNPTASTPTFSAGTIIPQTVTITCSTGPTACYNFTGSPATNGTTGCTTGILYSSPFIIAVPKTLYAVCGGTGFTDSSVGTQTFIPPTAAAPGMFASMSGPANPKELTRRVSQ